MNVAIAEVRAEHTNAATVEVQEEPILHLHVSLLLLKEEWKDAKATVVEEADHQVVVALQKDRAAEVEDLHGTN